MNDQTSTDGQAEDGQPITPQPKAIVDLRNTLAARPAPRRPTSAGASQARAGSAAEATRSDTSNSARDANAGRAAPQRSSAPRRPRHTIFYVPAEVSTQVRDAARRADLTNADLVFDAIEATRDQLPVLLAPPALPTSNDQLFARAKRRPSAKKVQISAIISAGNLAAIDRLVSELGADSRSHLVEVALAAYLSADVTATARA